MYFGITFRTYKEAGSGKQVLEQVLDIQETGSGGNKFWTSKNTF
jgi:hypothetical protein